MEKNIIEKYELIDGHAIIDMNYNIITANEEMYRFIGISTMTSILESIHQVDLDDFMDVAHHLRQDQEADMVIRMRRSDNSYRWILLHIAHFQFVSTDNSFEYFELSASDILALKKQNATLQNNMQSFRHLLAMENELFFIYDYKTHNFKINNFIDNEIHNIIDMDISELTSKMEDEHLISDDTIDEYNAFVADMKKGTVSYTHRFKTNMLTKKAEYDLIELKVTTIYSENKPAKAVASIRNLTNSQGYQSVTTYNFEKAGSYFTSADIEQFCDNNIQYNPACEFSLMLLEIDDLDVMTAEAGKEPNGLPARAPLPRRPAASGKSPHGGVRRAGSGTASPGCRIRSGHGPRVGRSWRFRASYRERSPPARVHRPSGACKVPSSRCP